MSMLSLGLHHCIHQLSGFARAGLVLNILGSAQL